MRSSTVHASEQLDLDSSHQTCPSFHHSNAGQGSQCHPVGLGHHVGPSTIPRKFRANILSTESHGMNSKEHHYPHPHDYSPYCGAHERIPQPDQRIRPTFEIGGHDWPLTWRHKFCQKCLSSCVVKCNVML